MTLSPVLLRLSLIVALIANGVTGAFAATQMQTAHVAEIAAEAKPEPVTRNDAVKPPCHEHIGRRQPCRYVRHELRRRTWRTGLLRFREMRLRVHAPRRRHSDEPAYAPSAYRPRVRPTSLDVGPCHACPSASDPTSDRLSVPGRRRAPFRLHGCPRSAVLRVGWIVAQRTLLPFRDVFRSFHVF
jgi:hypothetical protein